VRAYAATLRLRAPAPAGSTPGTFDEYLLHPARSHTDPGCEWLRGVLKEVGAQLERSYRI
jgi:hypothetical protein